MLLIYLVLPNHRNVPGLKTCFVVFGCILSLIGMLYVNTMVLLLPGIISSTSWMNVMCYDCYKLSRALIEEDADKVEKKRFVISCVFGWVLPVAVSVVLNSYIIFENSLIISFVKGFHVLLCLSVILILITFISVVFLVMAWWNGVLEGQRLARYKFTIVLFIAITIMNTVAPFTLQIAMYAFPIFLITMSVIIFIICVLRTSAYF